MPARAESAVTRRCILDGKRHQTEAMVRMVIDPAGTLVPDVAEKLPGRGVWVRADRERIETALDSKVFIKAVSQSLKRKMPVEAIPDGLADQIERLLAKRILDRLGLEKAAGRIILGHEKVRAALKDPQVVIAKVFQACDASADGRDKVAALAKVRNIAVSALFDRQELSLALGRDNVVHMVVIAGGVLERLEMDMVRLSGFRKSPQMKDKKSYG